MATEAAQPFEFSPHKNGINSNQEELPEQDNDHMMKKEEIDAFLNSKNLIKLSNEYSNVENELVTHEEPIETVSFKVASNMDSILLHQCAMKIQRQWKYYNQRKEKNILLNDIMNSISLKAAVIIQKHWKIYQKKKNLYHQKAVIIQNQWKIFQSKLALIKSNDKLLNQAAIMIQKHWKKFQACQVLYRLSRSKPKPFWMHLYIPSIQNFRTEEIEVVITVFTKPYDIQVFQKRIEHVHLRRNGPPILLPGMTEDYRIVFTAIMKCSNRRNTIASITPSTIPKFKFKKATSTTSKSWNLLPKAFQKKRNYEVLGQKVIDLIDLPSQTQFFHKNISFSDSKDFILDTSYTTSITLDDTSSCVLQHFPSSMRLNEAITLEFTYSWNSMAYTTHCGYAYVSELPSLMPRSKKNTSQWSKFKQWSSNSMTSTLNRRPLTARPKSSTRSFFGSNVCSNSVPHSTTSRIPSNSTFNSTIYPSHIHSERVNKGPICNSSIPQWCCLTGDQLIVFEDKLNISKPYFILDLGSEYVELWPREHTKLLELKKETIHEEQVYGFDMLSHQGESRYLFELFSPHERDSWIKKIEHCAIHMIA